MSSSGAAFGSKSTAPIHPRTRRGIPSHSMDYFCVVGHCRAFVYCKRLSLAVKLCGAFLWASTPLYTKRECTLCHSVPLCAVFIFCFLGVVEAARSIVDHCATPYIQSNVPIPFCSFEVSPKWYVVGFGTPKNTCFLEFIIWYFELLSFFLISFIFLLW